MLSDDDATRTRKESSMDTNIAAWMIAGGPHVETHAQAREREQLHAFRDSQREANAGRPGILDRLRAIGRPQPVERDLAWCPA